MDALAAVLKSGYKIVKGFSDPHKPVSTIEYYVVALVSTTTATSTTYYVVHYSKTLPAKTCRYLPVLPVFHVCIQWFSLIEIPFKYWNCCKIIVQNYSPFFLLSLEMVL